MLQNAYQDVRRHFAKQSPKRPLVAARCLSRGRFRNLWGVGLRTVWGHFRGVSGAFVMAELQYSPTSTLALKWYLQPRIPIYSMNFMEQNHWTPSINQPRSTQHSDLPPCCSKSNPNSVYESNPITWLSSSSVHFRGRLIHNQVNTPSVLSQSKSRPNCRNSMK